MVRARELLSHAADPGLSPLPTPAGISRPSGERLRYQRSLLGTAHLQVTSCSALLEALRRTAHDRRDRVLLAWPCRPDNGFVAAALHLLEGRTSGQHAAQAVALWPWRKGITHSSRSLLVEPEGLVRCARAAALERREGAAWTKGAFGSDAHEMVHLRLDDLRKEQRGNASGITVRLPSLLEMTSVFAPNQGPVPYLSDPGQILHRVRKHTGLGGRNGLSVHHVRMLGDPASTPLAVFGLPGSDDNLLAKCLAFPRFKMRRLDTVIIDLTKTALNDLGETWPKALARLATALERLGSARPGAVVLTDDVFVFRKSEKILRDAACAARPRRPAPELTGMMLHTHGFLGTASAILHDYPPMAVRADLKDARLLALRNEVLRNAREMDEGEDQHAAAALRSGLGFVRAMASLPVGMQEVRSIAELMHGTEDDADRAVRRKFFPATALHPLMEQTRVSPHAEALLTFRSRFMAIVTAWSDATPVSAKLADIAARMGKDAQNVLLVLPDRHVANLYNLSDAAQAAGWRVAEPRTMLETARVYSCDHWIVVRPTNDTLRVLLTALPGPRKLDLLGDAAGAALLEAELRPVVTLEAFAPLRARALALKKAIGQSVSNLVLDHEEATARTTSAHEELDFTRSDGDYTGVRIRIHTEQGYALLYRPASDVLRHTPDDLRAFERAQAQSVAVADTVLVLTKNLMELLRRELARAPQTVDTLRDYHSQVGTRCCGLQGNGARDKARGILHTIQERHPAFSDQELGNVVRWLAVDASTLDDPSAQPQAPRTRQRFKWFMDALGFPTALADAWWEQGIKRTRSYRLSEGMQFNQRAVAFVTDPESFVARGMNAGSLQHAIADSLDTVTRVEVIDGRGS